MNKLPHLVSILVLCLLTACGVGSGSSGDDTTANTDTDSNTEQPIDNESVDHNEEEQEPVAHNGAESATEEEDDEESKSESPAAFDIAVFDSATFEQMRSSKVKKITQELGFVITAFLFIVNSSAIKADETINHTFRSGDVISADVLNDVIAKLNDRLKGFTSPAELVGTWTCRSYISIIWNVSSGTLLGSVNAHSGYVENSNGMVYVAEQEVNFLDDGDGTYSYTAEFSLRDQAESYSVATVKVSDPQVADYDLIDNLLILGPNSNWISGITDNAGWSVDTIITRITRLGPNKFYSVFGHNDVNTICERLIKAPTLTTQLQVSHEAGLVTLTWTDNLTDETGFKVLRKDSLTGTFSLIGTATADSTSFEDTVEAGKYWYRIVATNNNGDSMGSNVVIVESEGASSNTDSNNTGNDTPVD